MFGFGNSKEKEIQKIKSQSGTTGDLIYKSTLNFGFLVVELDSDGIVKFANDNFLNALNSSSIEIEGQPFTTLMETTSKDLLEYQKKFKDSLKLKKKWKGVVRLKSLKETQIDLICTMVPQIKNQQIEKFIIASTNFTKFSQERRSFFKQFYTDPLTGFSNRQKLIDNLEYLSKQHDSTMIMFDIDSFGNVNDFFGYNIGDALLKEMGNWLDKKRPTNNTLFYKLPVDHYAMLITEEFSRDNLTKLLRNITEKVAEVSFDCMGNELSVTITIGASQGRFDLLKNTNSALSKAKKELKPYIIYDNQHNQDEEIGKNLQMIKIIKNALENNNIIPVFQPLVEAKTNKVAKYETLMRLRNEDGELVSPYFFLDIGIQAKLYPKMLNQMLDKAFQYYKASEKDFSINFSIEDMLDPQLSNPILKLINKYKMGKRIVIEILESQDITDYKVINEAIENFRKHGCQIAIDDFGSGYSNFEHILKLKLDIIKIDGSLIKNIDTDKGAELLVKTIVAFAKEAGLKTVAEFVHNAAVFKKVRNLGVDYLQGYFLAPPSEHLLNR